MIEFIVFVLASFSLSFLIKELDGPFDIISWSRNHLMTNKFVGPFFYKLLTAKNLKGYL